MDARASVLVACLWAGDTLTTGYGIAVAGAVELNPLGPVLALSAKALACVAAVWLVGHVKHPLAAITPFALALLVPIIWNVAMLGGMLWTT